MQNQYRKFLKSITLMLIVFIVYNVSGNTNLFKNAKLYQVSKRNLLFKEREYLKTNPLSRELRSFIQRYKRKAKHYIQKREYEKQLDKENMFVVKDGDILPLNEVDVSGGREIDDIKFSHEDDDKFTILPLIVPVTVSRERIKTCSEDFFVPMLEVTTEKICSKEPVRRLGKLREISTNNDIEETTTITTTTSTRNPTTTTHITTTPTTPAPTTATDTTTIPTTPSTTAFSNTTNSEEPTSLSGFPVNTKLLNRVYEDIKELMGAQSTPRETESAICNVIGDWDSTTGGMQIRIVVQNDTKYPEVVLVEKDPPANEGIFKGGDWSLSAFIPFSKSSSILVLNAYTLKGEKFVAVFVGECRICENKEAISGHWLIQRQSTDCSDREVSHKFISEVLKKNNVRKLRFNSLAASKPIV